MTGRRLGPWLLPIVLRAGPVYRRTLGRRIRIVAVVGSVGKTTTMRTVSAALGVRVRRPALLNQNSPTGVSRALLSARPWQHHAVVEAGIDGPGQMRRHAARMRPNIVVVTAIARDHWQSLPTIEITRDEKADMVRALPPTAVVVLNADDPNVRWIGTQTRARVVLVGEAEDADVRATEVELDWPRGMRFIAHVGGDAHRVRVQLLGRHMVFPALAAIAVAQIESIPLDSVVTALASVEPTPGRMQTLVLANGAVVIRDDFKGTTDALSAALDTLASTPARRRIAVLGGISETTGRDDYRAAGRRTGAVVDRAIFVGTSTEAQLYRAGAVSAGLARDRIDHVHHANEAVELLREELTEGDVVLIRGRWQQALGRVGLALADRNVQCRADPCPMKRMLCDICPMLELPFTGLPGGAQPD